MILSSYGRDNGKAFKYTEISKDLVREHDLFSDIVDHWIRHYGWEDDRDQVYPEEDSLFRGVRDRREVRIRETEDTLEVAYGIPIDVENSLQYVEKVWEDEMKTMLERNSVEELVDHHLEGRTLSNIFGERGAA